MKTIYTSEAEKNQAKINKFIMTIVYQVFILSVVVLATVYNSELAQWGVVGYCVIVGIALFSFIVIALSRPEVIARTVLKRNDSWKDTLTPTGTVRRFIGTFVTGIEVALLLTHGWLVVGTIWAVAELFQYLSVRKMRMAAEFYEDDEIDFDEETGDIVNAKTGEPIDELSLNKEFLTPELDAKLIEFQTELDELETQLRRLLSHNNGALPPEGSLNRKDFDELNARRDALIESLEGTVLDALKDFEQRS
jgi:hypothetical protein